MSELLEAYIPPSIACGSGVMYEGKRYLIVESYTYGIGNGGLKVLLTMSPYTMCEPDILNKASCKKNKPSKPKKKSK